VDWCAFTDVSEVCNASIIRAIEAVQTSEREQAMWPALKLMLMNYFDVISAV
jgi:hypothetical protein